MKKAGILAVLIVALGGCNKNLQTRQVPEPVLSAFYRDYPNPTRVTWEMKRGGLIEANVNHYGELREILYEPDGTVVKIDN